MCAAETTSTLFKEAAAQAQLRSAVYLMLSRVLLYPGPGVEESWQQGMAALEALGGDGGWQGLVLPQDLPEEWVLTFTHSCPKDCPPYETEYDARSAFQQTHRLARLGGVYKAVGVTAAPRGRPGHPRGGAGGARPLSCRPRARGGGGFPGRPGAAERGVLGGGAAAPGSPHLAPGRGSLY